MHVQNCLHLHLLLTYVQDERKVEPTIKLVEDREKVNDFLTWIQKDRPCAPTRKWVVTMVGSILMKL